jgi:O-antigen/teichoic acid export membrane protein
MRSDVEETFRRYSSTDGVRAELKSKSVRGALYLASSGGADLALKVVTIAILSRLISPEHFGFIGMVTAVTALVDGFRDLGLSAATVQRPTITHQQVSNLFWINAAAGAAFALLFCAVAPLIAAFYNEPRLTHVTIGMAVVVLLAGLSIQHSALMTRQLRQGELAVIFLGSSAISTLVAWLLAANGWGYWALVWREIARALFSLIGVWLRCRWVPSWPRRSEGTGEMLRFGRDLGLTSLLTSLIANIDRLVIGRVAGAVAVGMYRQAQSLLMVPIEQLNAPIISVSQPALSALQHDPERYRRYYEKIVLLVSLTTVPCGLFVAVYAEEVTRLVLGQQWVAAAVFVRIFAAAAAIRPALATSAVVLITCGRSGRFLVLAIAHSALLVILIFAGLGWGPEGVALAHLAATVILMIPKLYLSFQDTPVSLESFWRATRLPLFAGLVMASGLTLAKIFLPVGGVLPTLLVGGVLGGFLYVGVWLLHARGRVQLQTLGQDLMEWRPKAA